MKEFKTGDKVPYGIYGSLKSIDLRYVGADDDILDGKKNASYIKIPSLLLVALAPAIGGIFVLGFPLLVIIGLFAIPIYYGTKHMADVTKDAAAKVGEVNWEPSAAYMDGRKEKIESAKKNESTPKELEELEERVYKKKTLEK